MAQQLLGLSESLPSLVDRTYSKAKASGEVIFAASEATVISTEAGLPFQLRYCPSLAKKPTQDHKDEQKKKKPKANPFENPSPHMVIAHVPKSNPTHSLILNKFPIIAEHFMLITKMPKQQTHLLEPDDLEAVHNCLRAWSGTTSNGRSRRLFAFFNSGKESGASQPHRHVQFLPVENMYVGMEGEEWGLLADRLSGGTSDGQVPFLYWWRRLSSEPTRDQLHQIYTDLYGEAATAVDKYVARHHGELKLQDTKDGTSAFSYNMAMTSNSMLICPRRSDGSMLHSQDGKEVGFVALNGTLLGGTLMVKHSEEWEYLRSTRGAMDEVLTRIGIPIEDVTASGAEDIKL